MKQKIVHTLLAVLIAFGVWVYVVTVVSPESEATYYNIPVVLNNEAVLTDKGLMVTSDTAPTVTLQLRGNRSDLNNLRNSDITIIADLSKINEAGEQKLNCSISFTGKGTNAFEILNQDSREITLQIVEWSTKDVPVTLNYLGSLGLDYIAYKDKAELDRESITITGPKSVVDQIAQARIDVDLTGQVDTISQSYRYTLCDAEGEPVDASTIKTNAAEVSLMLKIHRVKEIQLLLDVTYGGGATAETTTIVLDQQVIKVAGREKLLEGFDTLVIDSVDLSQISADTVIPININLPEGLENLSGITQVNASITFEGLTTRVMNISRIFVSNKPENMVADVSAKVQAVTLRGPTELINALTEEYVWIVIDLSGAVLGEEYYSAEVCVDSSFPDVGVIGSYNIVVELTEIAGGTE